MMNALKLFKFTTQPCLSLSHVMNFRTAAPLLINLTEPLLGEPLKKKKKADPQKLRDREDKKIKKFQKQIDKIEKKGKALKPIDEIEGDRAIIKTKHMRVRTPVVLEDEEIERRASLMKDWQKYKHLQFVKEEKILQQKLNLRCQALDELKKESNELYQKAIQIDEKLVPFMRTGPVDTPPVKSYIPPDGDHVDTTKDFLKILK